MPGSRSGQEMRSTACLRRRCQHQHQPRSPGAQLGKFDSTGGLHLDRAKTLGSGEILHSKLFNSTECPAKLFPLGYLLFCRLLLMQIAKVGSFMKNSGNLLQDRHKNFEN